MDKATLMRRLTTVIDQLDGMHEEIVSTATRMNVKPEEVKLPSGELMLSPILVAQANALSALATLRTAPGDPDLMNRLKRVERAYFYKAHGETNEKIAERLGITLPEVHTILKED